MALSSAADPSVNSLQTHRCFSKRHSKFCSRNAARSRNARFKSFRGGPEGRHRAEEWFDRVPFRRLAWRAFAQSTNVFVVEPQPSEATSERPANDSRCTPAPPPPTRAIPNRPRSPSSCAKVWAMSDTVWARSRRFTKRSAQSRGLAGTGIQHRGQRIHGVAQLFAGHGVRASFRPEAPPGIPATDWMASPTPANRLDSTQRFLNEIAAPCPSTRRCPARFPLSTLEIYFGSRGCRRTRVVPIVKMAAKQFHLLESFESWLPAARTASSRANPSQIARTQALKAGTGQCSSAKFDEPPPAWDLPESYPGAASDPYRSTNVSKKRQVRRETERRARTCSAEIAVRRRRPRRQADPARHRRRGNPERRRTEARPSNAWRPHATNRAKRGQRQHHAARHSPVNARRYSGSLRDLACAAVTHCSMFLCVTNSRTSVRTIASAISHAW